LFFEIGFIFLRISISNDKNAKVFDVVNFDMINIINLGFVPRCVAWIHQGADAIPCVAISESETTNVHVYDGRGGLLKSLEKIHLKPVTCIAYNHTFDTVISADEGGFVEYWSVFFSSSRSQCGLLPWMCGFFPGQESKATFNFLKKVWCLPQN